MNQHNYDPKSLSSIALMSIGSSTIWELVATIIYYPFDLIKVRMQRRSKFQYKNTSDGFYQILYESKGFLKIKELYRGLSMYAVTYWISSALEFMIYETILAAITNYCKIKSDISPENTKDYIEEGK